jgi:hypothetical protein
MTGTEPTGEPWPFAWPPNEHCYSHNAHEPIPEKYYRICGECWHVFVTPEELMAEHNNRLDEVGAPLGGCTVDQIPCCPLCTHDF